MSERGLGLSRFLKDDGMNFGVTPAGMMDGTHEFAMR